MGKEKLEKISQGETNNTLERKEKKIIIKGRERRNKRVHERRREKKKKVVQIFLQCFDGRSSVARELKSVYSTRATSRYQERKDSVFHAPRGRSFSYSGSFLFKGRKWSCGSDPTTELSFRP